MIDHVAFWALKLVRDTSITSLVDVEVLWAYKTLVHALHSRVISHKLQWAILNAGHVVKIIVFLTCCTMAD
jgi:hypothetical protein